MNKTLILVVASILMTVSTVVLPGAEEKALGQGHAQHSGHARQKAGQHSHSGVAKDAMTAGREAVKMSKPMKMRCRMMMNMEVTAYDPAALLALREQLSLTEGQTNRLRTTIAQARQQAEQVLTEEQKAQLRLLETTPKTMMEMHHQMIAKMGQAKGGTKMQMMCPMMEMMEHIEHEQPAENAHAAEHGHQH